VRHVACTGRNSYCSGNLNRRHPMVDIGVEGRVILKWILNK